MAFFSQDRARFLIDMLEPEHRTRVIDIGAHPIHRPMYRDLLNIGECDLWGFEPQQDAFNALMQSRGDYEYYFPHAVGDGTRRELYICASEGFTSLFPPNTRTLDYLGRWHKAMTVKEKLDLETKRLDDIEEIPPADLIKIDVQGAETLVFENAPLQLSHAVAIITEVSFVPLYVGQPLYQEQATLLTRQGYILNKFLNIKKKALGSDLIGQLNWRKHQNQQIDGDAVFIRDISNPATISSEQLKQLAICADAVFESFDLVAKCLSLLVKRGVAKQTDAVRYMDMVPHQKE